MGSHVGKDTACIDDFRISQPVVRPRHGKLLQRADGEDGAAQCGATLLYGRNEEAIVRRCSERFRHTAWPAEFPTVFQTL